MRIISWNVNGFRSCVRKGALNDLIQEHDPDLLFIQELKCTEYEFLRVLGEYSHYISDNYLCYVDGSKIPGRYGVALIAKKSVALDTEGNSLIQWYDAEDIDPVFNGQRQSRLQAFVVDGILMLNTYSVRVTPEMEGLNNSQYYNNHILKLLSMWKELGNTQALVIGDINITQDALDQHEYKLTVPLIKMTPTQRDNYTALFNHPDLYDSFRELYPNRIKFSYWSYRTNGRGTGKGYRLDYAFVTNDLLQRVITSDVLTFVMGSDHAPIILEIYEEAKHGR